MGAKPRHSLKKMDSASADDVAKRALRLMRRGSFDKVVEATEDLFGAYAKVIDTEDPLSGSPIRGRIGYCLNFRGLAFLELGQPDDAIASFRIASEKCNHYEARIGLAELLCHHLKAYDEARTVARQPLIGEKLWFRKVHVDGFASLMLGDTAQAERCYRLIHDKYAGYRDDYIETTRSELQRVDASPAAEILSWFGKTATLDGDQLVTARRWWNDLDSVWQRQLRTLLKRESGKAARDKAANQKAPLTDSELGFILSREKFGLDSSHKVESLDPIKALRSLKEVRVAYWQRDASFFEPLAELPALETLHISGNAIEDLSFVASMAKLKVLKASTNKITSIEPLRQCLELETLEIDSNPIADVSPIEALTKLRVLDCSCRPLTSLAPLASLKGLEVLRCRAHSLSTATSLRALGTLRNLTLKACRSVRPQDSSLTDTRLEDIEAVASLERLEKLELVFDPGDGINRLPPGTGDDLTLLGGLSGLKKLELWYAVFPSFDGLSSLKNLEALNLNGGVPCPSLESLGRHPTLKNLFLSGRGYIGLEGLAPLSTLTWMFLGEGAASKQSVKALKALRPDIKIQT